MSSYFYNRTIQKFVFSIGKALEWKKGYARTRTKVKMSTKLRVIISADRLTGDLVCVIIGLGMENDNGSRGMSTDRYRR